MRLVDADALIAKQASIAKTFARSDAQKSLIGRVMYNTEKSPTIDAIPVEWIRSKITGAKKDAGAVIHDGILKELLFNWQKEQEAQDG